MSYFAVFFILGMLGLLLALALAARALRGQR